MKLSGKNSGKRQKLIDINITPFVDIMLVLLIIFMVTAPMITNEIQVTLPSSKVETPPQSSDYMNLNIDANGNILINKQTFTPQELQSHLQAFKKDNRIHIYADKSTKYQDIIKVLEVLAQGGFVNTSFMVSK